MQQPPQFATSTPAGPPTSANAGAGACGSSSAAQAQPNLGRGILTVATGATSYISMAKDLALSLKLHCDHIPRAILTDSDDPELHRLFTHVIQYRMDPDETFLYKFDLFKMAPFAETLYIDCDSLVVGDVDFVWQLCADREFGYAGDTSSAGRHYGVDIADLCKRLNAASFVRLNGGMYCFRRDERARRIFERAREVYAEYESFGFGRCGGAKNDEPCFSTALSEAGVSPLADDGRSMRTLCWLEGPLHIDVLRGECEFVKKGQRVRPAIVHFAAWKNSPTYLRERVKLRMRFGHPVMQGCARVGGQCAFVAARVVELWRKRTLARTVWERVRRGLR